jgi:uncharacterized protein YbaP (TraB family)
MHPPRIRCLSLLLALLASTSLAWGASPVWEVKGQRNTVYLVGSIHMLAPSETLPASINRAYVAVEKIVMEIDMDDIDPLAAQSAMMEMGLLPGDQTLSQVLGEDGTTQLNAQARDIGIDPALLSRFRPWLAAITLTQLQLMKKGMSPQSGVEMRLVERAQRDQKEITGLESLNEQLGLMANLSDRQQKAFLLYTLKEAAQADREIDSMLTAWRTGDTAAFATMIEKGFREFPELYGPLTVERNRRWMTRIDQLLRDDEDHMIVVGVLHMAGKDGLLDLLERKGYKITQH